MVKPILVVLAAGLGSRFGGPKQIAPVDEQGHVILDFLAFDARRAGFERVVFVVKPDMEADFRERIGDRIARSMDVRYAHQVLDDLPEGFTVPKGREKPWGTAHATLCAKKLVDAPFTVINADDFYGAKAFERIFSFLTSDVRPDYQAMVGYTVGNTLTENGHVARGVCRTDESDRLVEVVERTHIEKREGGAAYTEDDGATFTFLPENTIVSMNFWGFALETMADIERRFAGYLEANLPANPLRYEYFLPLVVNAQLGDKTSEYRVLHTGDTWYGITYPQDMGTLQAAIRRMKEQGIYPERLWED